MKQFDGICEYMYGEYIFVSYSHDDKEDVWPIIHKMEKHGLRLWFDKKIQVGSYWNDIIEQNIWNCGVFLLFVSPYYFSTEYCLKELKIAIEQQDKEFLIVYLEDTKLPEDIGIDLSKIQSIMLNQLSSYKNFYKQFFEKLSSADILNDCYLNRFELMEMFEIKKDDSWSFLENPDSLYFRVSHADSEKEARRLIFENQGFCTIEEDEDEDEDEDGDKNPLEPKDPILKIIVRAITPTQNKFGRKEKILFTIITIFTYLRIFLLFNYQKIGFDVGFDGKKYLLQNLAGFGIGWIIAILTLLFAFLAKKRYFYEGLDSPLLPLSIINFLFGAFFPNDTSLIVCQYIAIHLAGIAKIGMDASARELEKIEAKRRFNFNEKNDCTINSRRFLSLLIYLNAFVFLALYLLMIVSRF